MTDPIPPKAVRQDMLATLFAKPSPKISRLVQTASNISRSMGREFVINPAKLADFVRREAALAHRPKEPS